MPMVARIRQLCTSWVLVLVAWPCISMTESFSIPSGYVNNSRKQQIWYKNKSRSLVLRSSSPRSSSYERTSSDNDNASSSSAYSKKDFKKKDILRSNGKTFYEVLNCPPDATRAELKKSYVALARITHPDANIGQSQTQQQANTDNAAQFHEIAEAWRVLGDKLERRRYDRALKAEAFTGDVERFAADVSSKAAPAVNRIFEKVAMPIFRRAAATTIASASAAIDGVAATTKKSNASNTNNNTRNNNDSNTNNRNAAADISTAFQTVIKAGQNAAKAIDSMELIEKSNELEARAQSDLDRANAIRNNLSSIIDRRLNLSIFVPNSAISSDEAMHILDGLNTIDSVSVVDRMMLKNTVQYEIEALEELEEAYYTKADERNMAQIEYKEKQAALEQAEINAQAAMEAERRAREALEAAERLVMSSRQDLAECSKSLHNIDTWKKRTITETERVHQQLDRKREMVRKALLRKEEEVKNNNSNIIENNASGGDGSSGYSSSEGGNAAVLDEIAMLEKDVEQMGDTAINEVMKLRKEEAFLTTECQRLEERASRLRSRATKLRIRSEGIRSAMRQNGDDDDGGSNNTNEDGVDDVEYGSIEYNGGENGGAVDFGSSTTKGTL